MESILLSIKRLGYTNDDDQTDRMHYFVTSNLLIALSVLVSFKQFGGKPIECMTPPKFPGAWEDYAENYCWAQDTYIVPFDRRVPGELDDRDASKISYYQWVPFFLVFQAACFRAPSILYKYLMAKSGMCVHDLVDIGLNSKNIEPAVRKESIRSLTVYLQGALRFHRRLVRKNVTPHKYMVHRNLPFSAYFVTLVYMMVKVLYLLNSYWQFHLLNRFMETDRYSYYGFGAISDILGGKEWEQTRVFPRVTICDFQVRGDPANVQRYSVQCVLVINIFNEKIFIFLWFWYIILLSVTFLSLLSWTWFILNPFSSRKFVSRLLEMSEMPFDPIGSRIDVIRFVNKYLKTDGIFVCKMITMHAGAIFGTDLMLALWKSFYGIDEQVKAIESASNKEKLRESQKRNTPISPEDMKNDRKLTLLPLNMIPNLRRRLHRDSKDSGNHANAKDSNRLRRQNRRNTKSVDDDTQALMRKYIFADHEHNNLGALGAITSMQKRAGLTEEDDDGDDSVHGVTVAGQRPSAPQDAAADSRETTARVLAEMSLLRTKEQVDQENEKREQRREDQLKQQEEEREERERENEQRILTTV